jgi:uncharacterized protein (DUF1697 family)
VPATHVALIRGINVGGKHPVPMARLRSCLDERGFGDVRTYIQSGNVLLESGEDDATVAQAVERALKDEFSVATVVVALTATALRSAVEDAPTGFGNEPATYHYDVAFLHPRLTATDALASFAPRDGVDTVWAGERVVYFRRLSALRTKSRMSAVMSTPAYAHMTIRNWRTATALRDML